MKERGILFRGPLVRALMAGDKTQTRRPIKPQPHDIDGYGPMTVGEAAGRFGIVRVSDRGQPCMFQPCPYGMPGDRLWVRETHAMRHIDRPDRWFSTADIARVRAYGGAPATPGCHLRLDGDDVYIRYRAHPRTMEELAASPGFDSYAPTWDKPPRWRPGIHMPRWASRLTLPILDVRAERVQSISEADSWAEGIAHADGAFDDADVWRIAKETGWGYEDARSTFGALWCAVNGRASWDSNPWVWALTFSVERTY